MCGWFAGTFRRDFCRTLHMFGTSHCCNSSSSCISETRESTLALASAERRTFRIERGCLHPSLCLGRSVSCRDLANTPNHCEHIAANTRRRGRKLSNECGWLPTRRRQRKLSLHASDEPWTYTTTTAKFRISTNTFFHIARSFCPKSTTSQVRE